MPKQDVRKDKETTGQRKKSRLRATKQRRPRRLPAYVLGALTSLLPSLVIIVMGFFQELSINQLIRFGTLSLASTGLGICMYLCREVFSRVRNLGALVRHLLKQKEVDRKAIELIELALLRDVKNLSLYQTWTAVSAVLWAGVASNFLRYLELVSKPAIGNANNQASENIALSFDWFGLDAAAVFLAGFVFSLGVVKLCHHAKHIDQIRGLAGSVPLVSFFERTPKMLHGGKND